MHAICVRGHMYLSNVLWKDTWEEKGLGGIAI